MFYAIAVGIAMGVYISFEYLPQAVILQALIVDHDLHLCIYHLHTLSLSLQCEGLALAFCSPSGGISYYLLIRGTNLPRQ